MRGRAQPRQPTRKSMLDGASARASRLVMVLNLVLECLAGAVVASPVHQLGERRPPLPLTWPHPHPRKSSMLSPTTPRRSGPDPQPETPMFSKLPASGDSLVSDGNALAAALGKGEWPRLTMTPTKEGNVTCDDILIVFAQRNSTIVGDALSPEATTPLAAARSPCAQPLAQHLYLTHTLLLIPSTLRTLPCSPPQPCAHSPAHHLDLARALLPTTPTLRALPYSPPLPCAHSFDQYLYLARTPLLTTSPLCVLSCPPRLGEVHSHGATQPCIQAKSTRHPRGCVGRSPTIFYFLFFFL